jgi:hypothetical protein
MDWDKKKKYIDREMAFMAGSIQFIQKDLKSIQEKLQDIIKEKKDG